MIEHWQARSTTTPHVVDIHVYRITDTLIIAWIQTKYFVDVVSVVPSVWRVLAMNFNAKFIGSEEIDDAYSVA